MPTLVVVSGPPRTGKTTLAHAISPPRTRWDPGIRLQRSGSTVDASRCEGTLSARSRMDLHEPAGPQLGGSSLDGMCWLQAFVATGHSKPGPGS